MTITGPRVKDFTGDPARFPVEIVYAPVFELLMSLFTFSSMQDEDNGLTEFAVGDEWHAGVLDVASPDLISTLEALRGTAEIWITLVGTAVVLPKPRSIRSLVETIRSGDPVEQRLEYLVKGCKHCKISDDRTLQQRAAEGDTSAIDALEADPSCNLSDGLRLLLTMEPASSTSLLAGAIELFDRDVFHGGAEIVGVLQRDADHKRAMAKTMPTPQLVEVATNGITFEAQPEVDGIVLIPSIVIRPWVTIGSAGRRRVFCYPVADQHLAADPDSPPAHLVDVYKALGDERRLRLMQLLAADGPISLADVTDRVGLAKSTVHHHLSILRQAGLVLITVGSDKAYSLRRDAIPEAAELLARFLTPQE